LIDNTYVGKPGVEEKFDTLNEVDLRSINNLIALGFGVECVRQIFSRNIT